METCVVLNSDICKQTADYWIVKVTTKLNVRKKIEFFSFVISNSIKPTAVNHFFGRCIIWHVKCQNIRALFNIL